MSFRPVETLRSDSDEYGTRSATVKSKVVLLQSRSSGVDTRLNIDNEGQDKRHNNDSYVADDERQWLRASRRRVDSSDSGVRRHGCAVVTDRSPTTRRCKRDCAKRREILSEQTDTDGETCRRTLVEI